MAVQKQFLICASCLAFASMSFLFPACSKTTKSELQLVQSQHDQRNEAELKLEKEAKHRAFVQAYVDKNAEKLVHYTMRLAAADAPNSRLQGVIEGASVKKVSPLDPKNQLTLAPIVYLDFLKTRYEARQYAPIFFPNPEVSPQIEALIDALQNLPSHALGPKFIDTEAWAAALAHLKARNAAERKPFALTEAEKGQIVEHILTHQLNVKDSQAIGDMMVFFVKDATAMPRLKEAVASRAKAKQNNVLVMAGLELMTADLCIRFARAIRFDNLSHLSKEEEATLGRRVKQSDYDAISMARFEPWFDELVEILDKGVESIEASIEALYPAHKQYKALMQLRDRYAALPDWPTVKPARLLPRRSSPAVVDLRKRLEIEGHYKMAASENGDVGTEAQDELSSTVYDDRLRAAVELYHETHQLAYDADKGPQRGFWSSLNRTRAERLAQIEENLRRWHKTQLFESNYYIYINVPDFHGELWREGKRIHRFPIVAGNAKRTCDPETKTWKYINATPRMHARMLYVEYNPYWNVPPRIEQEDYIEKINNDPQWLENNGFEYYTEKGYTILRQLPSERNALGRVKFIFPNDESTFMHDSPHQGLFNYPVRSFSHGCMRVWDPMKLAQYILEYDGQWVDSLMTDIEDLETRRFVLKNRFDVFIDYFTVTVDQDGYGNFLADPYRYVRDAIDPPSPQSLECTPQARAWIPRMPASELAGEDVAVETDGIEVDEDVDLVGGFE